MIQSQKYLKNGKDEVHIKNENSLSALFDMFEFEDGDYEIEVIGNIHENQELLEELK